jgi:hypothetical protein
MTPRANTGSGVWKESGMTAESKSTAKDAQSIVPVPRTITIAGVECEVRRIKTMAALTLLQVIVLGYGPELGKLKWNSENKDDLVGQLMGVLLIAIPRQLTQFLKVMRDLVVPIDLDKIEEIDAALKDPELDVMVEILDVVLDQEVDDMLELMGKVRAMLPKLMKGLESQPAGK